VINLSRDDKNPIPLDDPELVGHMLRYLYGTYYLGPPEETQTTMTTKKNKKGDKIYRHRSGSLYDCLTIKPTSDAIIHAQMCGVADFYDIPDLKTLARRKLNDAVKKWDWNSHTFIEVLSLVCNPPLERDAELQKIMIETIAAHPSLLEKAEIEVILHENPIFAVALVKHAYKGAKRLSLDY